jgi:dienelactone hydrolase
VGQLQAFLWRPEGAGPFPAIVYNHGSEVDPNAGTQGDVGPFFSRNGYVVLFPYRRGAGRSEGTYWRRRVAQRSGGDQEQATVAALEAENDDVVAAINWLRPQPFVDARAISVAGCSFGGIESLLTAERQVGVASAVDFAGGAMAWNGSPVLRERMQAAAKAARVPVFFVQAENDFNTAPSEVLSRAMLAAGKPCRMRIFPRFGSSHPDGHGGFCMNGTAVWGPAVLEFLKTGR